MSRIDYLAPKLIKKADKIADVLMQPEVLSVAVTGRNVFLRLKIAV